MHYAHSDPLKNILVVGYKTDRISTVDPGVSKLNEKILTLWSIAELSSGELVHYKNMATPLRALDDMLPGKKCRFVGKEGPRKQQLQPSPKNGTSFLCCSALILSVAATTPISERRSLEKTSKTILFE